MLTPVRSAADLSKARAGLGTSLREFGLPESHIQAVEAVANELLVTALEAGAAPVRLYVKPFELLTSVRVRCDRVIDVPDDPFEIRGRILQSLSVAFGLRDNLNGTADLWAEVDRACLRDPALHADC
jgi:hypothetical protein